MDEPFLTIEKEEESFHSMFECLDISYHALGSSIQSAKTHCYKQSQCELPNRLDNPGWACIQPGQIFKILRSQYFRQGNARNSLHNGIPDGTKQNLSSIFLTVCDVDSKRKDQAPS